MTDNSLNQNTYGTVGGYPVPQQYQTQTSSTLPSNYPGQQQYQPQYPGQQYQPQYPGQQQYQPQQQIQIHEHPLMQVNSQECTICKQKQMNQMGSGCNQCKIDICPSCYVKFSNVQQPTKTHKCNLLLKKRTNWRCDVCNKPNPSTCSMYCNNHGFDMCPDCFFKESVNQWIWYVSRLFL